MISTVLKLGAVHKRRPHKIAKNWPLPLCPQNVRAGSIPSPSCPCRHTINFKKSKVFCAKKPKTEEPPFPPCPKNVHTGQPSSHWLRTSFMDGSLPTQNFFIVKERNRRNTNIWWRQLTCSFFTFFWVKGHNLPTW